MSNPSYSLVTASISPPVNYREAAEHMRVDSDADDDYIIALLGAAREYVEGVTGKSTVSASYLLTAPTWESINKGSNGAAFIPLDRSPLVSVDSVKYIAEGESTLTTMDSGDYAAITKANPGGIFFDPSYSLPSLNPNRPDAVQITFVAGYETIEESSPLVRHAIKLLAAQWYENRIPVAGVMLHKIPYTLSDILNNQRSGGHFV